MADEIFEIPLCPLCGKPHKYLVSVKRSSYLFSRESSALKSSSTKMRNIKRLFTCPKTNEIFEATLELTEDSYNKIETVTVEHVIHEAKDGSKK